MSCLPIPAVFDDTLSYSFKQFNSSDVSSKNLRPPKLYTKNESNYINKSLNSSTAHIISFKSDTNSSKLDRSGNAISECLLLPINCANKNETYFEKYFDKISKIGEGSFGEVFKVKSKVDGNYYAVKKSKYLLRSETYRQGWLEEVKRYEEFSEQEHCVTLYKAWQQNNRLYMQMELCRCSLDAYVIERKTIPETMIWSVMLDILLAIKSLHDKELIHLDIKLENILITDEEICKLGDFGLVVNLNRENLHLATEGDSRYIAPELMHCDFTKAADIFSLGIAILELSCNLELPPNGPLWQQLRSGKFPTEFYKTLSNDLQFIIKSMMAPDPKLRPSVDSLLKHQKLAKIRRKRSKWKFIKQIKNFLNSLKRFFLNKMCNLKIILNHYLSLKKKKVKNDDDDASGDGLLDPLVTPNSYNNKEDEEDDELIKYESTPIILQPDDNSDVNNSKPISPFFLTVVNSTPLNHNTGSNKRKQRKDLSRSHLSFDVSDDEASTYEEHENEVSDWAEPHPLMCKKLFYSDSE